jgi:hypothetical protein
MDENGKVYGQRLLPLDPKNSTNFKLVEPEHSGYNLLVTFANKESSSVMISKEAEFVIAGLKRIKDSNSFLWSKKITSEELSKYFQFTGRYK